MEGKYKQVCIEDDCRNVPLQDWVEEKLLAQFVLANMDIILKKVGDETLQQQLQKVLLTAEMVILLLILISRILKENEYLDVSVNADVIKSDSRMFLQTWKCSEIKM